MPESKLAVIAGYGAGISAAFVNILGANGYKLALLARTQSRLDEAVAGEHGGTLASSGLRRVCKASQTLCYSGLWNLQAVRAAFNHLQSPRC